MLVLLLTHSLECLNKYFYNLKKLYDGNLFIAHTLLFTHCVILITF